MMNFKDTLIELLKSDERFLIEGELSLNHVKDSIDSLDEGLLDLLYNNEQTREKFFEKNKNSDYIKFKSKDFKFYLDENKLDNSYTQFENQIGLFFDNKLLKNRGEVVLNFPFKDCILEGGQSRDDGEDVYFEYSEKTNDFEEKIGKRKEIFFNEVLGKDEIDRLKEDKVLVNWKRFTKNGEEKVGKIKRDENGLIRENLIIKGNNLLALHSLKKEFFGEIKLIYIDPPYNTGGDSFKYNDNFNHSTWLTFMKNRLEVAKDLLRDDGVIFVQCDDNEQAYLKVLMDEVFGRENFIQTGVVNRASEIATGNTIQKHEYFIVFSKVFSKFVTDGKGKYTISRGTVGNENQTMPIITFPKGLKCVNIKDGVYNETRKIEGSSENIENLDPIIVKNGYLDCDVRLRARWRSSNDMRNFFNNGCKPTRAKINGIIEEIYFENDRFNPQIKKSTFEKLSSLILDNKRGSKDLEDIGLGGEFDFPKSEIFLYNILETVLKEGDIVLDYHLGSGTTCSVAHKMGVQYIGIEQMDYIETLSVERLKKVIKGEKGGISDKVNWNGGGEFIYVELKKWNEEAKEKIMNFNNLEELEVFFDGMYNKYFLNYNVKIKEFKEKILKDEKFRSLDLEKQKKMFVSMLDLNQMYVNMSERKDKKFGISDEDVKLSEEFYGLR